MAGDRRNLFDELDRAMTDRMLGISRLTLERWETSERRKKILTSILILVGTATILSLMACSHSVENFIGKWERDGGADRIEIKSDLTIKRHSTIVMFKREEKASPGLEYLSGNWAVMGDNTPYELTLTIAGKNYEVDKDSVSTVPKYTSPELNSRSQDGNTYIIKTYGTQKINARGRLKGPNLLEVYVIGTHTGMQQKIVLFTLSLEGGKLRLSPVHLHDAKEGFFSKSL